MPSELEISSDISVDDLISDLGLSEEVSSGSSVPEVETSVSVDDLISDLNIEEPQEEGGGFVDSAIQFGGQLLEGATTRVSSNISPSAQPAQVFEDFSEEDGSFVGDVGRGFGDVGGDLATVGAFAAAGSVVPGIGTAAGATIGTGLTIVQGVRSELAEVGERVRAAGGSEDDVFDAQVKSSGFIALGEFGDFLPFVSLVPKKFRKRALRAGGEVVEEVAEEGVEAATNALTKLGFIKSVLKGSAGEAATEGVQTLGTEAVVTSQTTEATFSEAAEAQIADVAERGIDSPVGRAVAVGGIVGGAARGGVDVGVEVIARNKQRQDGQIDEEVQTEFETDEAAIEVVSAVAEVSDPDTATDSVAIESDIVTEDQLQQVVAEEPGLEVQTSEEGQLLVAKVEEGAEGEQAQIPEGQNPAEQLVIQEDPQAQPQEITNLEVPVESRPRDAEGDLAIDNIERSPANIERATDLETAVDVLDSNTEKTINRARTREQQSSVVPTDKQRRLPNAISAASIKQFKDRKESERVRDGAVEPEVAEVFGESKYIPITDEDSLRQVQEKITRNGLVDSALDSINGTFSPELTGKNKASFVAETRAQLNNKVKELRDGGLPEDRQFFANLAADVSHSLAELKTEAGQTLQAFSQFANSPSEVILSSVDKLRRKFFKDRGRQFEALSAETQIKITDLADKIEQLPEDSVFSRDLHRQMLAEVAREDKTSPADVVTAMWYANILSGPNTQAINVFGNGTNLFLRSLGTSLSNNPKASFQMLKGMLEGAKQGGLEAKAALQGKDISRALEKIQAPGALENISGIKSWGKFVFRALAAGDGFFYRTAREGRAYLAAAQAALNDDSSTDVSFSEAIAERLHNSTQEATEATAQAKQEAQIFGSEDATDIKRRAYEILEQKRGEEIRSESDRFGASATFTNPPDGLMGHIARGINNTIESAVIPTKAGDVKVLKPVVPFVNIVANVVSNSLDFTPIGAARFLRGGKIIGRDGRFESTQEKYDSLGNAIVGMAGTGMLFALAQQFEDEDDPYFAVYGEGPENFQDKKNLRSQGWKPFSIKIGDSYIQYNETPLALMFAILGGYFDGVRYKDFRAPTEALAFAVTRATRAFLEAGFLEGISNIFETLEGKRKPASTLTSLGKGFVPAQGLIRDLGRIVDPKLVDSRTGNTGEDLWASVIKGVPIVQQLGTRPMLNALGQPIEIDALSRTPFVSRFASQRTDDPNWSWIAENGLTLPGLQGKVKIGVGRSKAAKAKIASIKDERMETLGRVFFDTFTPDEYYEFVELQGAKVTAAIERLRESELEGEVLQTQLDKEVRNARRDAKLEMLGIPKTRKKRSRNSRLR